MQHWENMHQAVATGKSIIIYTSKVNASIFPRADLAENTVTVIELICRYMGSEKGKDPSVKIGMSATTAYTDVVNCGIL